MASDGSAPVRGVGQLNDGVEASVNDAKPAFIPLRLRNPRGVGLSHRPERHSPKETEQRESEPEDHGITFQGDDTIPRFAHLPLHMHDPRGARVSRPMEEVNAADSASENQVESATPEANHVRFSHLPRLHNPRGVNVVKQIQAGMNKESERQAGDEGDKN